MDPFCSSTEVWLQVTFSWLDSQIQKCSVPKITHYLLFSARRDYSMENHRYLLPKATMTESKWLKPTTRLKARNGHKDFLLILDTTPLDLKLSTRNAHLRWRLAVDV